MNEYDVKRLALVLATQAEIEGMKADNDLCQVHSCNPRHDYSDFIRKSNELRELANKHNEQL